MAVATAAHLEVFQPDEQPPEHTTFLELVADLISQEEVEHSSGRHREEWDSIVWDTEDMVCNLEALAAQRAIAI